MAKSYSQEKADYARVASQVKAADLAVQAAKAAGRQVEQAAYAAKHRAK